MRNPWIALDVATPASTRARELRIARERFLETTHVAPGLRAPIVDSWRRTIAAGVDPTQRRAPIDFAEDEAKDRLAEHRLGRLLSTINSALASIATESEHILAITDADGRLLSVQGDARVRHAAAEEMNFIAGARFGEVDAGTNAIGTALAAEHPIQVFAAEHLCDHSQWWTCVAAPIRDLTNGAVVGTVNLTARMETTHPHSLALVMMAAAALEAAGSAPASSRRSVHVPSLDGPVVPSGEIPLELDVLGRDRARLGVAGRDLPLSQRHSEILVLLAANPAGLTAEQLAIGLYGDEGKPVTARAEFSRLRRLLGVHLETEPYRLAGTLRSDLLALRQRLLEGDARRAAEIFRGSVLPRSEAPGVVELRDELDGWMRRTVMSAEDPEALWSWLATPPGAEDLPAWKRFLSNVPPNDGRRGLAAARLARLRAIFEPAAA